MPRHFFNFQNGSITLDDTGIDLPDLSAVRDEAVKTIGAAISEDSTKCFWDGRPVRLWVTDGPGGTGKTILALRVTLDQE
jgi:hypothetical protein